jgi:hypothetical protein
MNVEEWRVELYITNPKHSTSSGIKANISNIHCYVCNLSNLVIFPNYAWSVHQTVNMLVHQPSSWDWDYVCMCPGVT